jgi:hypothetical protein
MDEAAEVDVLGAVANNPHLSTWQIESYSVISKTSVHGIAPTTYCYTRNCMGTIFKIVYNFVNGHSNNCRQIKTFSKMFFLLMKLHSQITGKWTPEICTTGPQRTRDGFDKLSINANGA